MAVEIGTTNFKDNIKQSQPSGSEANVRALHERNQKHFTQPCGQTTYERNAGKYTTTLKNTLV